MVLKGRVLLLILIQERVGVDVLLVRLRELRVAAELVRDKLDGERVLLALLGPGGVLVALWIVLGLNHLLVLAPHLLPLEPCLLLVRLFLWKHGGDLITPLTLSGL